MPAIMIQFNQEDAAFAPGEPIAGTVAWDLPRKAERVVVRLVWRTTGECAEDIGVAAEQELDTTSRKGQGTFHFPSIDGPYSFTGKLFQVRWTVQATSDPIGTIGQQPFTLAPTKQAVGL